MIWFTSDQHFYHENVIKYCARPFKSVEEMNETIIERFNELVSPDDIVFHLGDFSLSRRAVEVFLPRLKGKHQLICGNHDHCHPVHAKTPGRIERMTEFYKSFGFETVALQSTLMIAKTFVKLHHMPYFNPETERYDLRYKEWRPREDGAWLLHGHIHEKWKQKGRMINVGVDVWDFRPVSEAQIAALISQ